LLVPADAPVIIPDEEPAVALELLLVHVPPPPSVKVMEEPTHTCEGPLMLPGAGLTVTVRVAVHVPDGYESV